MKKIIIITKEKSEVILEDNDDTELIEYAEKISTVLSNGKVTILNTTSEATIVRPSDISIIRVSESKTDKEIPVEINSEEEEDIITDVD